MLNFDSDSESPPKRARMMFGEMPSPPSVPRNPCEDISQKMSEGFNINLAIKPKIEPQCKYEKDGKIFRINVKDLNVDTLLADIPVYDEVPKLDGIYTWIVYDDNKFASTKVTSIFEIGSVHQVLALRKRAGRIIAAGELLIKDGKKAFNFTSGTFMLPLMKSREKRFTCRPDDLDDFLTAKMKDIFGKDSIKISKVKSTDSPPTFIKDPPSDAELDLYVKHGAKIEQYDSVEDCKKAQSAGRKRKTLKRRNIKKRNTIRTKRSKRY